MPQKKDISVVGRVRKKAEDFAEFTGERVGRAKVKTEEYVQENPWKSIAIAAGIGAIIGAVVALGTKALIERRQPTFSERVRNRVKDWL